MPEHIAGGIGLWLCVVVSGIYHLIVFQHLEFVADQQDLIAIGREHLARTHEQVIVGDGLVGIALCIKHRSHDLLYHAQLPDFGWA